MSALPKLAPDQQMTIEEFLAFTASRPAEERWELIEGGPVLSASPTDYHQIIVNNLGTFPENAKRAKRASVRRRSRQPVSTTFSSCPRSV